MSVGNTGIPMKLPSWTIPTLLSLLPAIAIAEQPPVHFEPFGDYFTAAGGDFEARIESRQLRLRSRDSADGAVVRWLGCRARGFEWRATDRGIHELLLGSEPILLAFERAAFQRGSSARALSRSRRLFPFPRKSARVRRSPRPRSRLDQVRFEIPSEASMTPEGNLEFGRMDLF